MPRVTQAHLDARRREILGAAYRCFARGGFHDVTMQQIAQAAGLSVGALYRYFAGKDALIEALAARGREEKRGVMAALEAGTGSEPLAGLVTALVELLLASSDARTTVRLDVRLWGEALDQRTLRRVVTEGLRAFRAPIAAYVQREREVGRLRADVDPEMVARLLLSLIAGLELQLAFDAGLDAREYVATARRLLASLGA